MDIYSNRYELFRPDRIRAKPKGKNSSFELGINTSLPNQNTIKNPKPDSNK